MLISLIAIGISQTYVFFFAQSIYHVYTVIHFTLHSVHCLGSALDTRVANFNDTAHDVCAEDFFSCNIYYMYMQACVLRLTSRSYRRLPHYSTLHITFIIIPLNANTMPCHNSKMCRRCSRQLMPAGWQFDTLMAIANIDYFVVVVVVFLSFLCRP